MEFLIRGAGVVLRLSGYKYLTSSRSSLYIIFSNETINKTTTIKKSCKIVVQTIFFLQNSKKEITFAEKNFNGLKK